jgi:hypothetical protein
VASRIVALENAPWARQERGGNIGICPTPCIFLKIKIEGNTPNITKNV